jgi:hypothetical protein
VVLKSSYLSVRSSSLEAKAPNRSTENRYIAVVVRVADNVPIGIERCVSFSEADRFDPAIIPVTAGKKRPTKALKHQKNVSKMNFRMHKECVKCTKMNFHIYSACPKCTHSLGHPKQWKSPLQIII